MKLSNLKRVMCVCGCFFCRFGFSTTCFFIIYWIFLRDAIYFWYLLFFFSSKKFCSCLQFLHPHDIYFMSSQLGINFNEHTSTIYSTSVGRLSMEVHSAPLVPPSAATVRQRAMIPPLDTTAGIHWEKMYNFFLFFWCFIIVLIFNAYPKKHS